MSNHLALRVSAAAFVLTIVCLESTANTPPMVSSVTNSPEAPLGARYFSGLAGRASVSAAGNAAYELPLQLPPGTGEATPNLSISYNSNVENGLLGLGWFLQGVDAKITRCPQTVAQDGQRHAVDYSADDRFCLNGQRLLATNGAYGQSGTEYKTESDQFSRITSHGSAGGGPSYFTVHRKDGHVDSYGNTANSAVELGSDPDVRMWRLDRSEDRSGNYFTIEYHENSAAGESYPTKLEYSGNVAAGVNPNVTIDFVYEARSDNPASYQAGSTIHRHSKRLSEIKLIVAGAEQYRYELQYSEVGPGSFSRLNTITQCAAVCREPVQIAWESDGQPGYAMSVMDTPTFRELIWGTYQGSARTPRYTRYPRWHDLNGDGRSDYILANPTRDDRTEFDVKLSGPNGYTDETWFSVTGFYESTTHWVDVDSDGRIDLVNTRRPGVGGEIAVSLSKPGGFVNSLWGTYPAHRDRFQVLDMDGDHLPDVVSIDEIWSSPINNVTVRVQLNTGTSFAAEAIWALDSPNHVHLGDFNGDGLPDLIEETRYVRLNTGTGFGPRIDWGSSATMYTSTKYNVSFGDYNNDGLEDRRTTNSAGDWVLQLNTGTSFASDILSPQPLSVDMNGDGLLDKHVYFVERYTHANSYRYRSSITVTNSSDEVGMAAPPAIEVLPLTIWFDKYSGLGDLNGDGLVDISLKETWQCYSGHINWFFYMYSCEEDTSRIYTNTAGKMNLVSTITEGAGRVIDFEYDWLASENHYTKGSGAVLPELDIQDSTRIVAKMTTSDGIGGVLETTYDYEGYQWNLDGRGILGFAKITSENVDTGIRTISEYEQAFPLVMQPKKVQQRRVSDNRLLTETETVYSVQGTVGSGPVYAYPATQIARQFAPSDGRLLVTQTTTSTMDAYGNMTAQTTATDDVETGEVRQQVVTNTFNSPDLVNWRVGQLASTRTDFWLNGGFSSSQSRRTDFGYDVSSGLVNSITREPGGGAGIEMTTTRTHDAFGNVLTETVAGPGLAARTTTRVFDIRGQFPITTTNPLGHITTQTWDATWGTPLSQTDPNGLVTSWQYDELGQLELENRPDGTSVSIMAYEDPTGSGVGARFYQQTLTSGQPPKRTFVDLLGRTVRERTQGFDGSYINVDSVYDAKGHLAQQSEPYFDGNTVPWNLFAYDDLGRVTALTAADPTASSTSSYNGFTSTVTDNAGRSETRTLDASGRVLRVIDKNGEDLLVSFDAQGNRSQVTAAAGTAVASTVTYTYDRYGRLLQQNDPDHGVYTYTYDALGNQLSEVSPEMATASPAQSRTFVYDLLGRMTSRTEPEGTSTWTYDSSASGNLGIGKPHSESQAGFSRQYAYGPGNHGRVTSVQTTIGAAVYTETRSYDSLGHLASETFPASPSSPGGFTVAYTHNALGYLERVQSPGGSQVYYQTVNTDAAGRLTEEWLGDGATATTAYEGVSGRVASQLSQHTATVQQFSYSYDASGNLLSRSDDLQSLSEAFSFDNLDRLTSAQVNGQTAATFAFDAAGSITQKSDVADSYDYLMGPAHAVTLLTQGSSGRSLSYDGNGNFALGTNLPTVLWSSYNKPTQLSKSGITYTFTYGPDRKRFKKQRNTETTYYIGSRFEYRFGGAAETFRTAIHANGKAIMIREDVTGGAGPTHRYLHRDHLGSVTAITDEATGNIIERLSYDAWGLRRNATTWAAGTVTASDHRGYTGHEHLDDIGIIHMNGRIYSPSLGRMLSPDPVTQSPDNGQNYNRYSYAFNNPLKYTDPSGFSALDEVLSQEFEERTRGGSYLSWGISDGSYAARNPNSRAEAFGHSYFLNNSNRNPNRPQPTGQLSLGGPPPELKSGDDMKDGGQILDPITVDLNFGRDDCDNRSLPGEGCAQLIPTSDVIVYEATVVDRYGTAVSFVVDNIDSVIRAKNPMVRLITELGGVELGKAARSVKIDRVVYEGLQLQVYNINYEFGSRGWWKDVGSPLLGEEISRSTTTQILLGR